MDHYKVSTIIKLDKKARGHTSDRFDHPQLYKIKQVSK